MTPPARWMVTCSRCQFVNSPDAQYCQRCGEPVAPDLVADLRRRYDTLRSLDAAVAKGEGQQTVAMLRDALLDEYQRLRAPRAAGAPAAGAAPVTTPLPMPSTASAPPVAPIPAPLAGPVTTPLTAQAPAPAWAAPSGMYASSTGPAAPHGPVFSWRAFIADQAIAILAYLGGFLLLIATLTFEVSGWSALSNLAKLGGVTLVYVVFAALGLGLRNVVSLRTVSRVYLGVFALMTPLEALAVYRFALQAQGFSQAGMICLASFYAAVVYVALAARTRFATYAYLGWGAAFVGAVAVPEWASAGNIWWLSAAAIAALALLLPHEIGRARPEGVVAWLATPALWVSGLSAIGASLISLVFLAGELVSVPFSSSQQVTSGSQRLALAVTMVAMTLLSAGWYRIVRGRPHMGAAASLFACLVAAFGAAAAASTSLALDVDAGGLSLTLAGAALAEGLIIRALARALERQRGVTAGVRAITIVVAVLGVLYGLGRPNPDVPMIVACLAGLALGLLYAMSSQAVGTVLWGVTGGLFTLVGAFPVINAIVAPPSLYSTGDQLPGAVIELPSLYTGLVLGLTVIGLALRFTTSPDSRLRRLRFSAEIVAVLGALVAGLTLFGHTGGYSASILGIFSVVALAVGWIEREPAPATAVSAFFGSVAAVVFIATASSAFVVAIVAPIIAVVALAIFLGAGRIYGLAPYIVSLVASLTALLRLAAPLPGTPAALAGFPVGIGGLAALIVALLMAVAALREASLYWQIAPAGVALLSLSEASALWPMVVITLALAGVGMLARWMRGKGWNAPWQIAGLIASFYALQYAITGPGGNAELGAVTALIFLVVAWLVAWQDGLWWLTLAVIPYGLALFVEVGALQQSVQTRIGLTVGLTLALAVGGMTARLRVGRLWALALYAVAVIGSIFTFPRVYEMSSPAGLLESALLVYAAVAFIVAVIENAPLATLAPALYAAAAALVQPDGRALLPLALLLAAGAFAVSWLKGARWALPLYGAAVVAAAAAAWQSQTIPTFEPLALVTLALAAWALAALESRPDVIIVAIIFAALAVPATGRALQWENWQTELAFAGLAWVVSLSGFGWSGLPWLRARSGNWLTVFSTSAAGRAPWRDPRIAGRRVTRLAALVVGAGAVVGGVLAPDAFATAAAQTQVVAVSLAALTGLLVFEGLLARWRLALYIAAETAALCVTWELRWLGFDNAQAWIIAPGSAQILIGALLPTDHHVNAPRWVGQLFSVAGALILTLPTLGQSMTEAQPSQWIYALVLALEALVITLVAVGLRNRVLALTGSAFVGVAAIRGAVIAIGQNLPAPLFIGVAALGLMGFATWLSLRARRGSGGGPAQSDTP